MVIAEIPYTALANVLTSISLRFNDIDAGFGPQWKFYFIFLHIWTIKITSMALFKTDKPRQFSYTPRFYDARKEEMKERIERIEHDMSPSGEVSYESRIRGRMKARHEALHGSPNKSSSKSLVKRFTTLIYLALIVLILFYVFKILVVTK
jgi:hypothetical protein